tara:strand:+ start:256 stop:489 length:234 start_codon:yes stop_codon:yes gene_type:complete
MKNLHEIIDSLVELSASRRFDDNTLAHLDLVIDDLITLSIEQDAKINWRNLSKEEIEEIKLFEEIVKGVMQNKLALA